MALFSSLASTEPPHVAVLIASIGRESLVQTVRSLDAAANLTTPYVVTRIIVSDDSRDGAAARRLEAVQGLQTPIDVLPVASQNIATARNAGLEAVWDTDITHAAFVDDDEQVEPDWLSKMMELMLDTKADAVIGCVKAHYPPEAPDWFVALDPFGRIWGEHGAEIPTGATHNALVNLERVRAHQLAFDPALGRTGGEDTDFFFRLRKAGGRIVASREAIVHEPAPIARCTLAYLKLRAVRSGQTFARASVADKGGPQTYAFYADAALKAAISITAAAAFYGLKREKAAQYYLKYWSNVGKLRELLGLDVIQNYAPPAPSAQG